LYIKIFTDTFTQPVFILLARHSLQFMRPEQRDLLVRGGATSNKNYFGLALSANLMKPITQFPMCPVFSWQAFTMVSLSYQRHKSLLDSEHYTVIF